MEVAFIPLGSSPTVCGAACFLSSTHPTTARFAHPQGSVGKKTPLNRLENALIVGGIPVFTPMSDDQPLPDGSKGVMDEKVVFSSFHQASGSAGMSAPAPF